MSYPTKKDIIALLDSVNTKEITLASRVTTLEAEIKKLRMELNILQNNTCLDDTMKFMFKPMK